MTLKGGVMSLRQCFVILAVGLLIGGPRLVFGQDYPNKPIRIITTTPGGGNDTTCRILIPGLTGLSQQIVVVNNQSTVLAAEMAAKAPPDGYSLYVNGVSHWITPLLQKTP